MYTDGGLRRGVAYDLRTFHVNPRCVCVGGGGGGGTMDCVATVSFVMTQTITSALLPALSMASCTCNVLKNCSLVGFRKMPVAHMQKCSASPVAYITGTSLTFGMGLLIMGICV